MVLTKKVSVNEALMPFIHNYEVINMRVFYSVVIHFIWYLLVLIYWQNAKSTTWQIKNMYITLPISSCQLLGWAMLGLSHTPHTQLIMNSTRKKNSQEWWKTHTRWNQSSVSYNNERSPKADHCAIYTLPSILLLYLPSTVEHITLPLSALRSLPVQSLPAYLFTQRQTVRRKQWCKQWYKQWCKQWCKQWLPGSAAEYIMV